MPQTDSSENAGPIFVGGTGRSGTTWLAAVLGEHPEIWSLPVESRFIIDPGGFQDLAHDLTAAYTPYHGMAAMARLEELLTKRVSGRREDGSNLDWNVPDAVGRERFEAWRKRLLEDLEGYEYGGTRVARHFPDRSELVAKFGTYVDELFGGAATDNGKRLWCEKTPFNMLATDFLWEMLPTARMVHIVRHPVQVAASYVSQFWAPDDITAVCDWLEPVYRRFLERRPSHLADERYLEVRLEGLASDWPATRADLFGRLGLDDAPTTPLDADRVLHWSSLPAGDEAYVRERLGFAIEALAYE